MVGHKFGPRRGFHVHVCEGCGLIALSNDLTAEAIRLGCDFKYHPNCTQTKEILEGKKYKTEDIQLTSKGKKLKAVQA